MGHAEVLDRLVRVAGADEDEAAIDLMALGLGPVVQIDEVLATRAARLRSRHYHRRTRPVSMTDCVAAAAAQMHAIGLVTSDAPLLDLCLEERIAHVAIPNSSGALWKRRS
jgi:predicted nucleic acid-binding protein